MREIKFDAIYKPTGEHFEPNTIDFRQKIVTGNFDNQVNDWCHFSFDGKTGDVILREYAGLKDKNGKEIYEGDIVKVAWHYDSDIGTVKYIRSGFFVSDMKRHTSIPLGSISATYEIIGKYTKTRSYWRYNMTDKLQEIKEDYLLGEFFGKPWVSIPKINFDWLIETMEQLQEENNRYKDINQGLLEVQFSLRDKNKEYEQWFQHASNNVQEMENRIQELETIEKAYEALKKAL